MRNKGTVVTFFNKLKMFELDKAVKDWWQKEAVTAKLAFISAFISGFVSHLFIYTGRYYGRDDLGTIFSTRPSVSEARWLDMFITNLSLGYVMPLITGLFVTLFLALSAFFICKLFNIKNKFNAILLAGLIATYPSIANTNLFLLYTSTYHFAVLLGVLAVYITVKYRFGFLPGGILVMLTLAIYQTKFNVILALCLFYLVLRLLDDKIALKDSKNLFFRFASLAGLGAIFYLISLPISLYIYDTALIERRGATPGDMITRLRSFEVFTDALVQTYRNYYEGFLGHIYLVTSGLKYVYVVTALISVLFLVFIIIYQKMYKQYLRLGFIALLLVLMPFASNFANFFDPMDAYGVMIYAFVLTFIFAIALCERCVNIAPVMKTLFTLCLLFIIAHFVIGNNIYYLKAYYFNQRTESLTTRILARIDPFLSDVDEKQVAIFGTVPNEYYPESTNMFREYGPLRDGPALMDDSYIGYRDVVRDSNFVQNVNRLHGVRLRHIGNDYAEEKKALEKKILDLNMPAWPAEGCVGVIDGVICVNLRTADIVFEEDGDGQFFRARHYISEGHSGHEYEYQWKVYRNDTEIDSAVTNSARLYIDYLAEMLSAEDSCRVTVIINNTNVNFSYPMASINIDRWEVR